MVEEKEVMKVKEVVVVEKMGERWKRSRRKRETREDTSSDAQERRDGSLFLQHLPEGEGGEEEKQDDSYPSISVTFAPAAHTSSHTPPLSACHPHGVTVMLALPLPSVCHVVSLLLCNFLLFFLPLFSSFPERMCLLSLRRSVSGGLNSPFWASDSVTESRRCLADSKNSRPLFFLSFLLHFSARL